MAVTVQAHTPTSPKQKQKLPAGLSWARAWRNTSGDVVRGLDGVEVPIDADLRIAGVLWACPAEMCAHTPWTFDNGSAEAEARYCPRHGARLVRAPLSADDPDPVAGAKSRVASWARQVYQQRRDATVAAARARLELAQKAAADATRRTVTDMRGHVPSLAASTVVLAGGSVAAWQAGPVFVAAVGAGLAGFGVVVAYVVAYVVAKVRAQARLRATGETFDVAGRAGRRVRAHARHVGLGVAASGGWLMVAAAAGVDPTTRLGCFTLLLGCALAWAVNRAHWEELWAVRRRLRGLAQVRAEKAVARAAAEVERASAAPVDDADPDDAGEQGRRLAAEWRRIAALETVPVGLPIGRTWIVPEETREVTAPIDGELVRIGWQFAGECEPGALVPRLGMPSPLAGNRQWIADVLFDGRFDLATLSLVERPEGQANRFLLILTDKAPLGNAVRWMGPAGIRRLPDGSVLGHRGQDLQGNDVEEILYAPGQPAGGSVVGMSGGGKSVGRRLLLLNWLAGGIFPVLFDPKQLVDYGDFIGVVPIGVTLEHRDVVLESLAAERKRRERLMARKPKTDRFGRPRAGEPVWNLADGPPIGHMWEEFHDLVSDDAFVTALTNHMRFQRSSGFVSVLVSQGGGLSDVGNSMLRMLLNQVSLTTYRMDAHQARLAGSKHAEAVAGLPQIPGVCLVESPTTQPVPMRDAFVTREDEEGSVFDRLYGPNMEPLLAPPPLPEATVRTWERTGLMELWRKAQGPGGLDRLLADAEEGAGDAPPPAADGSSRLGAADVILAIVHLNPGCPRATVDKSDAWSRALAGGKAPKPSTITRAAARLEGDGMLTRVNNQWNLTDKSRAHAELMVAALLAGGPGQEPARKGPVAPVADTSQAAIERAVERQMETARLVAEQQVTPQ